MPEPPAKPVAKAPRMNKRTLLLVVAGLVVVLLGGVAYRLFMDSPPPPPPPKPVVKSVKPAPAASTPAPTPAPAAASPAPSAAAPAITPSATMNQLATVPKKAIDKTQDVVAARRNSEQARVDAMVEGRDVPDQRAISGPPPSQGMPPAATTAPKPAPVQVASASTTIAPGVTATSNEVLAVPAASAEFRRFVSNAVIKGVFQGSQPRAHLNGRIVRAGEVIDQSLGIVFDSVDADKKTITFSDSTGAKVTRKY
ncbi:MAG: hypothetical protein HZA31_06115 [Opitutae bacterium]|nr:hypothetical protein [Opitutae bacterium]